MSDRATELFEAFVDAREAGGAPDPAAAIAEAGDQGEALAGMLVAYLATHPRAASEDEVLALAARSELVPPAAWPTLLPELRERTHTTRSQLVKRLAELLDARTAEQQVAGYVHELEAGLLSPRRVRPQVVAALATALRAPQALLEASRALPSPPPAGAAMFAREGALPAAMMALPSIDPDGDPRIDDLFTGGEDG
jgi:hypothetical protein